LVGVQPSVTAKGTSTSPGPTLTSTTSPTPSTTPTFSAGEYGVVGRVVQNGNPLPNVLVKFADDTAPRQGITNSGGHYSFLTLAPGTTFTLTFNQADNPNLTPTADIASMARLEGTLPTGVNPIDFPDLEISINTGGMIFALQTPVDGASYSAAAINSSNPIQFIWSIYSQGGTYHIEVGPNGTDEPAWTSPPLTTSSYMWDGTLDTGSHITQGTYWWRVTSTRALSTYSVVIYTHSFDLIFNP
jgi:hypothetical protein